MTTDQVRNLARFFQEYSAGPTSRNWDFGHAAVLMADVVDAARAFIGHGHPRDVGCCQTDHYTDRFCDCGFSAIETALAAFDAAKLEE